MTTFHSFVAHSLAVALLVAGASQQSAAQRADTTRLNPVTVTATRVPRPAATVSAAITVITGDELRERGIFRVSDALLDVPGISVVRIGGPGATTSVFMRGGENDFVKVLIDGVPANAPGGAFDFAHLTTEDIDRIEIVRGPGSVLYGSDAVTGVIQIFTRDGAARSAFRAAARGGNFGVREGSASLAGGSVNRSYDLGASTSRTDGPHPFNSEYRNDAASGRISFAGGSGDARFSARLGDSRFHYPTDGSGAVVDSNAFRTERRVVLALDAGRRLSRRLEARILLGNKDLRAVSDDQPDSPGDSLGYYFDSRTDITRRTVEGRLNVSMARSIMLTTGSEVQDQWERSSGTSRFGSFPDTTESSEHRSNVAYFAQLLGGSDQALSWSLGMRRDNNERFGTFDTHRAGASLRLGARHRLRASLGTAFKEPAFAEIFDTPFTIGNPELRPEKSRAWDVGLERRMFARRAVVSVTYFDQKFSDVVQYQFDPTYTAPNYFNVAEATAAGVEFEGRAAAANGLSARFAYTRLWTKVTDSGFDIEPGALFVEGQRLLRRPTHSASAGFGKRAPTGEMFDLTIRYVGDRDDRDFSGWPAVPVVLPAYTTGDIAIELPLARGSARPGASAAARGAFTFRVENVLNARYDHAFGFAGMGRTYVAGMRIGPR